MIYLSFRNLRIEVSIGILITCVYTGLIVWFSARYLYIKRGAGKDNIIFHMAEYYVYLKNDIFICPLLSYLCLEV